MALDTLQLQDRYTHLTLAPATGGSIANWTAKESGQPLLRHSDEQALLAGTPRRLGCYPLAPWSNRISDGGFENPQGWLALEANAENSTLPIHGSAWQQPWQVVEHSEESALLRLASHVPFAYVAEQRIRLHDGRLDIHLQVTHLADTPMWHGLGLHPYFPRLPNTRLQARAGQVWECGSDSLPTQLSELPTEWNFTEARDLPKRHTDNAFTDWNGQARILQPDAGYSLEISAQGSGLYLLFCPEKLPFFCFEPVSHPVNAHHMSGKPGLVLLDRGQSHSLTFSLQYRALA